MSIPPRLAGKLNETLGPDAAGDLVTWLDEMRADLAEARQEMLAMEMRLREHTTSELHAMEARLGQRFDALAERIHTVGTNAAERILTVDAAAAERIHTVDTKAAERHVDLMRWSFVFWVGAVGAIALLAGVLRP